MTISKYCREAGVNLIDLSKKTGHTIPELNYIYSSDIGKFSSIIYNLENKYQFKYKCNLILESDRTFIKIGIIKAKHQQDAIKKVSLLYDCNKIEAVPYINGKITGSDKQFGYADGK